MKHLCLTAFFIYHGLAFGQGGNPVGAFTPPPSGPTFLRDVFRNREVAEKPQGNVEGIGISGRQLDVWAYKSIG
jgi:hypothetical protein